MQDHEYTHLPFTQAAPTSTQSSSTLTHIPHEISTVLPLQKHTRGMWDGTVCTGRFEGGRPRDKVRESGTYVAGECELSKEERGVVEGHMRDVNGGCHGTV